MRLPRVRAGWGLLAGLGVTVVATLALLPVRSHISRATPALVFVVPVVVAGLLGRRVAAVLTAVVAAAVYSFSFVPPFDRASIAQPEDVVALAVFMVVAVVVGTLVAVEADRRQAAEDRAEEVRVLAAEREVLREEASRAALLSKVAEQQSALLRSVSHDLRTPLATIQAVASDFRDGVDYPPETRDRLLALMADEAARLNRLVSNLLSMSRIEAGALAPDRQAVALDELIENRVVELTHVMDGRPVSVDLPADLPLVDADYSELDQVITNLLENAARHTPAGSSVHVGATVVDGFVQVTVADDGPGIAPSSGERVFEPFHRGAGTSGASSGLGLAICKAVIEAHGGRIWLDDPKLDGDRQGASISFTVPVHAR